MQTDTLSVRDNIIIKGAKLHNLKDIDVVIPKNKLVVITGLSGSGKSSLAFDTLYAEGQRRYVESLSSYSRQFLGKLNKPKVDYIKGISPAIAIEQKVNSTNPRSTVGTTTEIYDYIKLLFARIGKTYSPISGNEVKKNTVSNVVNFIKKFNIDTKLLLLSPIIIDENKDIKTVLYLLEQQGYARLKWNNEIFRIADFPVEKYDNEKLLLVIDRIVKKDDEDFYNRIADSVQTAFFEGKGICFVQNLDDNTTEEFSNKLELDGMSFLENSIHLFSFNNPFGACSKCEGYGSIIGIDEDLVIPNTNLSIYHDAIYPFKYNSFKTYKTELISCAYKFDIPIHKPWFELTKRQKNLVWKGNKFFKGINYLFKELETKSYKIQNRIILSRYRGKTKCTSCGGKRLRKEADFVKINEKSISDLVALSLDELSDFFKNIKLNEYERKIGKRLLIEINSRLKFLTEVGLSYLTINRASNTLSGGESQRINLATSLGSSLVGSMYILDEPSIGLHPKDTERLIGVLKNLRDLGNTVIVVEHDEDIMKQADYIIDIGPEAGAFGGNVVAKGNYNQILNSNSLTAKYLSGKLKIKVPTKHRSSKNNIKILGARKHNLKNIDITIPLNCLSVVTGVSGSGKSTLIKSVLYPAIKSKLSVFEDGKNLNTVIKGSFFSLNGVEFINQNPIGRSTRSNPATYVNAYDDIRYLFSRQKLSKIRNFTPKHFSFNIEGGRCRVCKGEGKVVIGMQFMADIDLKCEECDGKRFKKEVLEVIFKGKNIYDVLNLTVDEAIDFFSEDSITQISQKLKPLKGVGLGYVKLGQSSSTLSGGEAQRIKLASFLAQGNRGGKSLFIFDEPTIGLHFHDVKKLLDSFNALIHKGHSIIVIEHNIELIKCADYIIDLGLEGGKNGGNLIFQGTPKELSKNKISHTAKYLSEKLAL